MATGPEKNDFLIKLNFIIFELLFFCLSFQRIVLAPIIILWILTSLFLANNKIEIKISINDHRFITLIAISLVFTGHLTSILISNNKQEAIDILTTSLVLFIFPLLFIKKDYSYLCVNYKKLITSFISGVTLSSIICFVYAIVNFIRNDFHQYYKIEELGVWGNYFLYTSFSKFLHPTYFALLINIAIIIVLEQIINKLKKLNRRIIAYIFLLVYLSIIVILLSSKTNIFILAILCLIYFLRFCKVVHLRKISIISLFAFLFTGVIILFFTNKRMMEFFIEAKLLKEQDKNIVHYVNIGRMEIYSVAFTIVKENNIFLGTGSGDVKTEIYNTLLMQGKKSSKQLNAHNQFLEEIIGKGILGILGLIFLFFNVIWNSLKNRATIFTLMILVFLLNFMTESILLREVGVISFSLFYCLTIFLGYRESNT